MQLSFPCVFVISDVQQYHNGCQESIFSSLCLDVLNYWNQACGILHGDSYQCAYMYCVRHSVCVCVCVCVCVN